MSDNQTRQSAIENYIRAYNSFDVENMLKELNPNIEFRNISNGEVNLTTKGIEEFKKQAEQAKTFFSEREQKITNIGFEGDKVEIDVDYKAVLAVDGPNGLSAGSKLELKGKSIFRFEGKKIIEIEDIS